MREGYYQLISGYVISISTVVCVWESAL